MYELLKTTLKTNKQAFLLYLDSNSFSYEDKIEMAKFVLNKNQSIRFAVLCAESVLYIFEEKYPYDDRIRNCINVLKRIDDFESLSKEEKIEIRERRKEANEAAVQATHGMYSAAADAAHAAADAAYSINNDYLSYACAAYAAYSANNAVYAHDMTNGMKAKEFQKKLSIEFLKQVIFT